MRGSISKALSIACVLPLFLTGACLFKPRPEFPVNWTVRQFCVAGQAMPPPDTVETYEYRYSISFYHTDEVIVTLRPDGTGTLHARRIYESWQRVARATPDLELSAHMVECIRGVIVGMSFWADYTETTPEFLCMDGDSFDLTGRRGAEQRERSGFCDSWDYGPYVRVFAYALNQMRAFPGEAQVLLW
ncbi:MAG TPA: hypothetical protein PLA85_04885 [Micropepsaceae bacterium]|nr:hypothetical protein [Micropepsaceae bacterium]